MSEYVGGGTESINGFDMYYELYGRGEPLILLHGWTGIGANWNPFVEYFAEERQVVIPDLRGHGLSTNPSGRFTFRQCAEDVAALLDFLKIERCSAIGVSLGAETLLHLATMQPDRLDNMVLVSGTPYFPDEARRIMAEMPVEGRSEEEWYVMRQWHRHGDEQILTLWRLGREFKDSYDDVNFTPPLLGTIRARTLIVHGDRDPIYPVRLAFELHQGIRGSYLWVVPNGGHGPIFVNPGPFIETVVPFLRGEW